MNKVVLGGVLGAAGLVAAAIISNFNDDEVKHKFDLSKKEPSKTVDELHNQLVELDLSIVHLLQELSSIYIEFSDLVGDDNYYFEDLEDRGILGKIQDYIHEDEQFIFELIAAIPMDQRYGKEEMKRIIDVIEKYESSFG